MKEGEPILGGPQANPGVTSVPNPGATQPIFSATPQPGAPVQPQQPQAPQAPTTPLSARPHFTPRPQPQFQPQPISSGAGDINLPESTKKNKKPIIILFVLAIIVIAGAIVGVFVTRNNVSVKNPTSDRNKLFNQYANYLLFQSDSDSDIPEGSWSTDKINENLSNADSGKEYFSNLINLYNKFSDYFKNNTNETDPADEEGPDIAEGLLENTSYALGSLQIYAGMPHITTEAMINLYLTQGGEKMLQSVKDAYGDLAESENYTIYEYSTFKIELSEIIFNLYNEYNDAGCISDQKLSEECVASATFSESFSENKVLYEDYIDELDDIEWHISNDVVSLSHMFYEVLNIEEAANE